MASARAKIRYLHLFCLLATLLTSTVTWGQSIQITQVKGLRFNPTYTGFDQLIVTYPNDNNAAVFEINSAPFTAVTVSIVERFIFASAVNNAKKLKLADFTTGGSVDSAGNGVTDNTGHLDNIRIGGTADVRSNLPKDIYIGSLTLRVVPQ